MPKIDKEQLKAEIHAEKSRIAITNMGFKDDAPPFISIIGPEKSGKTTLLKNIIKKIWRKEKEYKGITTLKANKKRYTFYEAQNTLEDVIDTIKISDLIIFVINLEIGLQKDTMEALTMMNSIGVPKFLFVLTHYDQRQSNKILNDITKRLGKEFSFPIKHFCLEMENGSYHNIDKLIRQIDAMKYRPVEWKCSHPHIIVDNYKDGIGFGYVRGGPIGFSFKAHIPDYGDYNITEIEVVKDPCSMERKGNVFYNPLNSDNEKLEDESSSAETLDLKEDEIKLFDSDEDMAKNYIQEDINNIQIKVDYNEESGNENDSENKNYNNTTSNEESTSCTSTYTEDMKEEVRKKFKIKATEENELIDKFNEEYKKPIEKDLNSLETLKKKETKATEELKSLDSLILPGFYVKFKIVSLKLNDIQEESIEISLKYNKLMIIGTHLPGESDLGLLKGQIYKSKWHKGDLKSNNPYLISLGWYRLQTIPVFITNNVMIEKCKKTAEVAFYSPVVQSGTSFFVFDLYLTNKVIGVGKIMDTSGNVQLKKRLKLVGYPKQINGTNVIVQSMFSSSFESNRFLNAKVETESGLRGLVKTTVSNDGCVRASFEGTILMSDVIYLKCFVPFTPIKYFQYLQPGCKLINIPENENTSETTESACSEISEVYEDEYAKRREARNASEIKKLETKLPFKSRKIKKVEETIDLPLSPEEIKLKKIKDEYINTKRNYETRQEELKQQKLEKRKLKKEDDNKVKEEYKRKSAVKSHLEKKKHKKSKKK